MAPRPLNLGSDSNQRVFDDCVFPGIVLNKEPGGFTNIEDVEAWVAVHQAEIESMLAGSGAILFRGFPVKSAEIFDRFSAAFGYPAFTYAESLSNAVRINFTERVFTANEAPPEVEIFLHHEMAQTPIAPGKLFFYCHRAAQDGGATPLCRSDLMFLDMQNNQPSWAADFERLGVKYTTMMPEENDSTSGQGRSWRSTLGVDNVDHAEAKLQQLGYSWRWLRDNSLEATTPKLPAVRTMHNGKKTFFNQLIAAYRGWQGVKENPAKAITFGDGSFIPIERLEYVAGLTGAYTFDLAWQDGDVALIDNYSTMHGRRPYSGEVKRQVLVALSAGHDIRFSGE